MTNKLPHFDINEALTDMVQMVKGGERVEFLMWAEQYSLDGYRYHEGVLQISPEFGRDLQRTAAGVTFRAFMQFRRAPVNVIKADRSAARIIRSEAFQEGLPTVGVLPDDPLKPPLYTMDLQVNANDVVRIAIVRFSEDSDDYTPEAFYLQSRRLKGLIWSDTNSSDNMWP